MEHRLIVLGTQSAYFARREAGWSFMPAGPRGAELPMGVDVLTDESVSAALGRESAIDGDAVIPVYTVRL